MTIPSKHIAIWTLTATGATLGQRIQAYFQGSRLFVGRQFVDAPDDVVRFERLGDILPQHFNRFDGHVFIMATGIVVRSVAHLLRHKTEDPAVVVLDERGHHAISLLSGHLGGANALACRIGESIGARPVITTATDLQNVPAIDLIAQERKLLIENPVAIRHVSMALLEGQAISLHDPYGCLDGALPDECLRSGEFTTQPDSGGDNPFRVAGVWVDDIRIDLPAEILILRPASLFIGVGCNRNTPASEIRDLLNRVLDEHDLVSASVAGLASIDLKADEKGLLEFAGALKRPLVFFSRDQLATVSDIPSPSTVVEKHVGVKSVCEAAAILASGNGHLIVSKQTTSNVTIAIARKSYTLSA